ncbi:NlpC/P60 family protein [Desulfovibrio falkowii]|uniref:NlpC/P60 domain-containing protein n=1 Tax=Desulfovibrio falkowii TaxID=3136602 RepID=A0ABQ0E5D9_9BACT
MGKCLKLCALMMGCVLAFGCAAQKGPQEDSIDSLRAERFRRSYEAAFDSNQQEAGQQLLRKARSAIGTPYVRGGTTPDGFDCSGFVCWTYKSVGVQLPRTAREQSVIGQRITKVEDMRAGDIVAFRHPRRGYHTGIYVGDGKFIHSPRKRTKVRINSLDDPYFKTTFLSARRVKVEGGETLTAQAESRLSDFTEERVIRELARDKKKPAKSRAAATRDNKRTNTREKKRDATIQVASNDRKGAAPARAAEARNSKNAKQAAQTAKAPAKTAGKAQSKSQNKAGATAKKPDNKKTEAKKSAPAKTSAAKSDSGNKKNQGKDKNNRS